MKSLSNRIFKNNQVNMGLPFQIRPVFNINTIRHVDPLESVGEKKEENTASEPENRESCEEIIAKAREEVEFIIKEARYEAVKIVDQAQKEAQMDSLKANEEAKQKGYEEGIHQARQQYEDILNEAEFIREHAKADYQEVLAGIESDVINTVLEVAKKVIGVELSFNKEDVLYLVKQAFEKCGNKEHVVLKVSPEDYDYLVDNRDKLLSMIDSVGELEIRKDVSLKEGGCIIETPYGSIDAGVQTKFKKIEEAFRQICAR